MPYEVMAHKAKYSESHLMYLMANDHIGVVKSHAIRIHSKEGPLCWCYCQQVFSGKYVAANGVVKGGAPVTSVGVSERAREGATVTSTQR